MSGPVMPSTLTPRCPSGAAATSALRHAYATMLLARGVPTKVVRQRLGHADAAITMTIYQHVTAEDDTAVAEFGASLLAPTQDLTDDPTRRRLELTSWGCCVGSFRPRTV